MNTHATAVFEVKSWDEKPYLQLDASSKLTRASVTKTFRGDLTGNATSESLMFYHADGSATFVGLEHIEATIGGRTGSFVLQATGTYRDGTATADCTVVPGSGTGGLRGLRGVGRYVARHADYPNVPFTLDYRFE